MKQIKKLQSEGIYLIRSLASANSTYFENEEEMQNFWKKVNLYLSGYLKIKEYILNAHGFQFIIEVENRNTIYSRYSRFKSRNKSELECEIEIWEIISRRFQLFLSQYVMDINGSRGCRGSHVRGRYERYIFESVEEYERELKVMKENKKLMSQEAKRYASREEHVSWDESDSSILHYWNSCRERLHGKLTWRVKALSQCIDFQYFDRLLVAKLIELTHLSHLSQPHPS